MARGGLSRGGRRPLTVDGSLSDTMTGQNSDVAKAGGWVTVRMVEEVYTQADSETTLNVVIHEGRVREAR